MPLPQNPADASMPPVHVSVNLPATAIDLPSDDAKENASVARALRMLALQIAFRSLEFLGLAAYQKTVGAIVPTSTQHLEQLLNHSRCCRRLTWNSTLLSTPICLA